MSTSKLALITAVLLSSALAACGGGGGGGDSQSTTTGTPPSTTTVSSFVVNGGTATTHTAVAAGQPIYMTWSTNAGSCTINGSAATNGMTVTAQQVSAPTTNSYALNCGGATATASILVLPARTSILDVGFQQALTASGITVATDGTIDTNAALSVSDLEIQQDYGIADLTGISAFKGLTKLNVWNNASLTNVSEVSTLTNLTWLGIYQGQFTAIDVSKLTNLTLLGMTEIVGLNTVDTSTLTQLTEFDVQADCDDPASPWGKTQGMTSLDISKNVNLQSIDAACQRFTSLDFSHNPQLNQAWIDGNAGLTSIDFSHNPMLSSITVYRDTNLASLNLKGINGGNLPQRLSAYSTPSLATITVSNPAAYQAFMASATQTPETLPDGSSAVLYVNSTGSIGFNLGVGVTFSN